MKKFQRETFGVYLGMAAIGAMFMGPALDASATWAVKASNERHWVEAPISEFLELDGMIAFDIYPEDEKQRMRTIGIIHENVKAKGPHTMKCFVNGQVDENGYVEVGTEDIVLYTVEWDQPWVYDIRDNEERGIWRLPINREEVKDCPTNQVYWVVGITTIMPNGYERRPFVITSTVADIKLDDYESISYKPTPNVYELHTAPVALVLHTTLGSFDGAVQWLRTTPEERERQTGVKSYSSAHAVFGRYGEVAELAPVDKGTWHAGRVSNPSARAKAVMPRTLLGGIKNPNRHTIGLEFAAGYDIDRDGVLESWEKLYTKRQIQAAVEYVITRVEPQILEKHGLDIQFADATTITHRDVTSDKPNLEIQRAMFLAELKKQRSVDEPVVPAPIKEIVLKDGQSLKISEVGEDFIKLKF